MYVRELELAQFRCFDRERIELQVPQSEREGSNVTLLLGNNGAGKSSILRALALTTLCGIIDQSGFVPRYLVRWSSERKDKQASLTATVELTEQDAPGLTEDQRRVEQVEARIVRRRDTERVEGPDELHGAWEGLYDEDAASFLVLGYGATRREDFSESFDPAAQRKHRSARYQRVASLFEDQVALVPLRAWLPRASKDRRDEVIELINSLMPEAVRLLRPLQTNEHGDLIWLQDATMTPQSALSDGYRGFIALIGDIVYQLQKVAPRKTRLRELSGIVLIDEIDLHLHPSWQRVVAPTFARVFPRLQFVMTTHSPIVTGTLRAQNIIVLELARSSDEDSDGYPRVVAKRLHETVHGLNADQILVSDYFGLSTTRAPAAVDSQRELARRAAADDKDAAVEFVRQLASGVRDS